MTRITLPSLFLIAALSWVPARAAGITEVYTLAAVVDGFGNGNYASCGFGVLSCTEGPATVSMSTGPVISMTAVAGVPDPGLNDGAGGHISWAVDVLGGSSGDSVTLDVRYVMSATGNSNDSGADISFNGITLASVCDSCGAEPSYLDGVAQIVVLAGGSNIFTETVAANGYQSGSASVYQGSSSSSVFADPYIYIDPTFASTHPGYTLDFGNAGNQIPSTTPEPSTFVLMGAGVATVIAYAKRRTAARA